MQIMPVQTEQLGLFNSVAPGMNLITHMNMELSTGALKKIDMGPRLFHEKYTLKTKVANKFKGIHISIVSEMFA